MSTRGTAERTGAAVVRTADQRGLADFGWLKSRHTFSFGGYYDEAHMGFRSLRVINEDRVSGGGGFPTHPHRDMEIFSYVLEGALAHKDSLGTESVLKPGQIQLMSAGRGVTHSEYNPSPSAPTHFLQVWIEPREHGLKPGYTEWHPAPATNDTPKVLVISPDGRDGSAVIHQDAEVYCLRMASGRAVSHDVRPGRGVWLQVMRGSLTFDAVQLDAGDGASLERAGTVAIHASTDAEALLFDLR